MMRHLLVFSATLALLSGLISATTRAQGTQANTQNAQSGSNYDQVPGFTSDIQDPVVELHRIRQKREQAKAPSYALFQRSPLTPLRERGLAAEKRIYEATDIKFGTNLNTLMQGIAGEIPGSDTYGMASFLTTVATWDGFNKGESNQGEITLGLEGRWNWGTTDPTTLGTVGLGSLSYTSNPFTTYTPTFLVRNLFWRQGSREAGWMYRLGRVTPDQFLQTSAHITPLTTYLPIAGTGAFAMGLPDSGLGMFGGIFVNDRVNIAGVVTDANADRTNFGDLGEGDLFTAVELQAKILPVTPKAGYSKVTFWHNDGTKDGDAINGSTGAEGWGVFIKLEQELTHDGRLIGIGRWGRSYQDSALYDQQAAGHLVFYDPFCRGSFKDIGLNADLAGVAYNWVQPTGIPRDESNVELFYRFPLFPEMDATVSYQGIINPANNPSSDYGSAISLRLRSTW
jgi:porin